VFFFVFFVTFVVDHFVVPGEIFKFPFPDPAIIIIPPVPNRYNSGFIDKIFPEEKF